MAFVEDFTAYFADFGEAATLAGVAVRGIFDRPHQLAAVGQYGMASTQPTFSLPTAQVTTSIVGQSLVCLGVTYVVAAHEPDGTGLSVLQLETA